MEKNENEPLLSVQKNKYDENIFHQKNVQENGTINNNASLNVLPQLTIRQKISFGLGHIFNDLCASMWFSYTLLFFQSVLHMESTTSGSMMLLGQVMDALATPVIGMLADRWGSKRLWHLTGTCMVLLSFPLIFSRCLGCWMSNTGTYLKWWQPVYYAVVIVVFQCGWAIVQISHLAMIPVLTNNLNERSELTAIRYTSSVCSGVTVYVITWGILHLENTKMSLNPTDDYKFRDISLSLCLIGCILSIIFHFGIRQHMELFKKKLYIKVNSIRESTSSSDEKEITIPNESLQTNVKNVLITIGKKNFLLSPLLYQVALLYVASRLFNALSLVYVPLYLDERLSLPDSTETIELIAIVPLVTYVSSFFTSILLKYRGQLLNHKIFYIIGSLISISACIWISTLTVSMESYQLYVIAALFGMGSSITMVTSLCITADMIGPHSDQSAVVYSVVTFADKLITGVFVILIEEFKCEERSDCPDYYKNILAYVCGGSAVLGAVTILTWKIFSFAMCNSSNK